ncbi:short chain dehydrogenase [Mycobacterium dioxanotrophicus]|uniref:Short chain dehydrogenase n=1 Tax=Mycobacterium dioxanotrophicus TaxID=482462 RepID=A0A1Y0C4Z8_9MYCO|nr:SDR family oxidoreductase [Mycobacterium dioxanotrophicus]ART70308.1 short chain dehydrogenase [Mycobacterium dioxanotrophicus]
MPGFDLSGRVALITGGASGIGRAIAFAVAEHGADVAVLDLPGADATATLEGLTARGSRAVFTPASVESAEQLRDAVAQTESELGPLTLAVNAAGIANACPAEDMPVEQWQRVYSIDATGVFLSCQAEANAMLRNGTGSIVNISSMSGTIVNRGLFQCHYNSAKAAVTHLSKSLAMEWATRGIRVNSLSPGYTATPMNTRPEMVDSMAVFASETPMQRIADPAEMGGPAVFLLSDAASFVTGIDLLVDGGFCAQ